MSPWDFFCAVLLAILMLIGQTLASWIIIGFVTVITGIPWPIVFITYFFGVTAFIVA